mmetsp:Transcript_9360/g.33124  ORF Transcript_9360/g.33124 Transcript_9360/m.33124 type:complete len:757 (+) Transcript_9360:198-2468(+)
MSGVFVPVALRGHLGLDGKLLSSPSLRSACCPVPLPGLGVSRSVRAAVVGVERPLRLSALAAVASPAAAAVAAVRVAPVVAAAGVAAAVAAIAETEDVATVLLVGGTAATAAAPASAHQGSFQRGQVELPRVSNQCQCKCQEHLKSVTTDTWMPPRLAAGLPMMPPLALAFPLAVGFPVPPLAFAGLPLLFPMPPLALVLALTLVLARSRRRRRTAKLALALALASSVAPSVASSVASSVADSVAVLAPLEAVLPEAAPPLLVAVVAPPPVVLPIAILVTVPVASFSVTVSIPVSISVPAPVAVVGTAAVVLLAVRKLAPTAAVAQTSTEVVTRVRAVATLTVTVTVTITITVIAPIPSPIVLLGIHLLLALAASGRDDQRPSCDLLPLELAGRVLGRGVVSEPHLRDAPHRTIHLLGGQHVDAHEHARLDRTMQEGRNICGRPSGGKFPDLHEGLGRRRRLVELDLELRAVELLDGRPGDLRVFEASNGLVAHIEDLRRIGERTEDLQLGGNLGLEPVGGQIHPRLGEAAHHNILALCGEVEPVLAPAPRLRAIAHDVPRPSTDMADARLVPDLDVTRWVRVEAIWPRARDALPADTLRWVFVHLPAVGVQEEAAVALALPVKSAQRDGGVIVDASPTGMAIDALRILAGSAKTALLAAGALQWETLRPGLQLRKLRQCRLRGPAAAATAFAAPTAATAAAGRRGHHRRRGDAARHHHRREAGEPRRQHPSEGSSMWRRHEACTARWRHEVHGAA